MKTKLEQKIDNLKNSDAEFAIECINLREEEIIEMIRKWWKEKENKRISLEDNEGYYTEVYDEDIEDLIEQIKGEKANAK